MNNSVFISYRRNISAFIARAVFQDLRAHGIDVFMDVESINMGQFDTIILNQIAARPYFLVILTPGTLEHCKNPADWLLREMEYALKLERKIIPLLTPNFDFADVSSYLTGRLANELPRFNAVNVPYDYFDAAMDRLRTRFLKSIDLPVTPTPKADVSAVQQTVAQVIAKAPVTNKQLSAQDYFERALMRPQDDLDGKIADYTEAIRLNLQNADAFYNRGNAYQAKGNSDSAVADYSKAILLNPQYAEAYYGRGNVRCASGDVSGAIKDYNVVIQLNPQYVDAYIGRGRAQALKQNYWSAIADFQQALKMQSNHPQAEMILDDIEKWRRLI